MFSVLLAAATRTIRNQKKKRARNLRDAEKKVHAKMEVMANEEDVAERVLQYCKERDRADILQSEVNNLIIQLSYSKYASKGVFPVNSKNTWTNNELIQLPSLANIPPEMVEIRKSGMGSGGFGKIAIGCLIGCELEVALKRSKGFSQNTEGRVCQAVSRHQNFLLFFGMGNDIVLELVKTYHPELGIFVSSTVSHALQCKLSGDSFIWRKISHGIISGILYMHELKILHNDIKENNVLLKEARGDMVPKVCDFGKASLICCCSVQVK